MLLSMKIEDYAGHESVYGHSAEESDFWVSPLTAKRIMLDRSRCDQLSSLLCFVFKSALERNKYNDEEYEEDIINWL